MQLKISSRNIFPNISGSTKPKVGSVKPSQHTKGKATEAPVPAPTPATTTVKKRGCSSCVKRLR